MPCAYSPPAGRPGCRTPRNGAASPWCLDHRQLGRFALPSGVLAAGLTGIWIGFSLGADAVSTNYSFYDSDLGMRIVYEFPVLAGILPEG